MRKKIGLCLMLIGGLGLTCQLAVIALWYLPRGVASYLVLSLGLILGISLLVWGWRDSTAHKVDTRQESKDVYDNP